MKTKTVQLVICSPSGCQSVKQPRCQLAVKLSDSLTSRLSGCLSVRESSCIRRTDCQTVCRSDCLALLSVRLSSSFLCQTIQLSQLPDPSVRLYCLALPSVRLPAVPGISVYSVVPSVRLPNCHTAQPAHSSGYPAVYFLLFLAQILS